MEEYDIILIPQSWNWEYQPTGETLTRIEVAGRTCYKSEDKITETSAENFVKNLINSGHMSVIEHSFASIKVITTRGISHELVRHRLASFCLSGDSKILRFNQNKKHLTIKELFDRQQDNQLKGRNKLMLLRSMNENNKIVPNHFKQILYSGKKDMYRVTTKLGYSLKASKKHIFFTPTGKSQLKTLNIGDEVLVNGMELIKDKEWLKHQREMELSIKAIAEKAGVSYSTVRKYIRLFKLTKKNGNKPKEFIPWNKGLTENEDSRIKNQANALRKYHYNNQPKEKNSRWNAKGDLTISGLRLRFSKYPKIKCECCGSTQNLENHHRDKDITNWKETNKMTLCTQCHKAYHKGYNVKHAMPDKIISIQYVGKENSYDIEMAEPFHNFVANGFIVHNSQESTRYVNYKNKGLEIIYPEWFTRKTESLSIARHRLKTWETSIKGSIEGYLNLIETGLRPEDARGVLPIDLKTEIVISANLREWRHILKLRTSSGAHPQMKQLMKQVLEGFKQAIPCIFNDL